MSSNLSDSGIPKISAFVQSGDKHVIVEMAILKSLHTLLLSSLCTPKTSVICVNRILALCRDTQLHKIEYRQYRRTMVLLHIDREVIPGSKLSETVFVV